MALALTPRRLPTTSMMDSNRIVSINMEAADPSLDVGDGLDMNDMMHDFGAGDGIDMRDFTSGMDVPGEEVAETMDEDIKSGTMGQSMSTQPLPQHLTPQAQPMQPSSSVGPLDPPSSVGVDDVDDMFQTETGLDGDDDDDDDGDATPGAKRPRHNDVPGGFTYVDKDGEPGRRKIRIEYIADKSRRHITFSKRKAGIMKKAYELSILTGTQVLLLVVSETGLVYTFTTNKLQPLVQKAEGKNLIQACLNAPDGFGPDGQPLGGPVPATKAKNGGLAIRPHKLTAAAASAMAASAAAASEEHSSAQVDAAASIGQGTPVSVRPKKRLPSGKGKKANAAAAAEAAGAQGQPSHAEMIPPVPQIPDIHRQSSPNSAAMLQISGGYHIPPEYAQHHAHSPTTPNFGYPPTPSGPGDYGQPGAYYGTPQGYLHPQQGMYGHAHDGRGRMMMEGQRMPM